MNDLRRFLEIIWDGHIDAFAYYAVGHGGYWDERGKYQFPSGAWREDRRPINEIEEIAAFIEQKAGAADTYIAVLPGSDPNRRSKDGALGGRFSYSDVDNWGPECEPKWRELLAASPGSGLVGSGRGRHVYLDLGRIVPRAELECWNRRLRDYFGGDHKWDGAVVLRPPGTLNHKTNPPTPVEVLHWPGEGGAPDLGALDALLPPDTHRATPNVGSEKASAPEKRALPKISRTSEDLDSLPFERLRKLFVQSEVKDRSMGAWVLLQAFWAAGFRDEDLLPWMTSYLPLRDRGGSGLHNWLHDSEWGHLARRAEKHDHAGRNCIQARCPNAPIWLISEVFTPELKAFWREVNERGRISERDVKRKLSRNGRRSPEHVALAMEQAVKRGYWQGAKVSGTTKSFGMLFPGRSRPTTLVVDRETGEILERLSAHAGAAAGDGKTAGEADCGHISERNRGHISQQNEVLASVGAAGRACVLLGEPQNRCQIRASGGDMAALFGESDTSGRPLVDQALCHQCGEPTEDRTEAFRVPCCRHHGHQPGGRHRFPHQPQEVSV